MNYRAIGFTQRRPKVAGVYFISCENEGRLHGARISEGWDVALLYYYCGSFSDVYEQGEAHAVWRIKSLRGAEYAWRPGMWIKGPITPTSSPNPPQTPGSNS